MSEEKVKPFLTRPVVVDWLQWNTEFSDEPGKPNMVEITLKLIDEYRVEYNKLEEKNEKLKKERDAWEKQARLLGKALWKIGFQTVEESLMFYNDKPASGMPIQMIAHYAYQDYLKFLSENESEVK